MYCDAPRFLLRKFCALKLIKDLPRGEVLEIGCGAGSFTLELLHKGFTVRAIDLAAEAPFIVGLVGHIEPGRPELARFAASRR